MQIKPGEIIVETATGREYVIEEVAEASPAIPERWIGFRNLHTGKLYSFAQSQIEQDFHIRTSQ